MPIIREMNGSDNSIEHGGSQGVGETLRALLAAQDLKPFAGEQATRERSETEYSPNSMDNNSGLKVLHIPSAIMVTGFALGLFTCNPNVETPPAFSGPPQAINPNGGTYHGR